MKHARPDYAPIQDPRGKIPEDEPVFLLRGQDMLAPLTLDRYAMACRRAGLIDIAQATEGQAEAMRGWQREHGDKLPDLDDGDGTFNPLRDGKPPEAWGVTLPALPEISQQDRRKVASDLQAMADREQSPARRDLLSRLIAVIAG